MKVYEGRRISYIATLVYLVRDVLYPAPFIVMLVYPGFMLHQYTILDIFGDLDACHHENEHSYQTFCLVEVRCR